MAKKVNLDPRKFKQISSEDPKKKKLNEHYKKVNQKKSNDTESIHVNTVSHMYGRPLYGAEIKTDGDYKKGDTLYARRTDKGQKIVDKDYGTVQMVVDKVNKKNK